MFFQSMKSNLQTLNTTSKRQPLWRIAPSTEWSLTLCVKAGCIQVENISATCSGSIGKPLKVQMWFKMIGRIWNGIRLTFMLDIYGYIFIYVLLRNFETYPISPQIQVGFCCSPQKTGYATHMIILAKEKGPFLCSHSGQSWKELSLADFRMYGNHFGLQPVKLNSEFTPYRAPKGSKGSSSNNRSFFSRGKLAVKLWGELCTFTNYSEGCVLTIPLSCKRPCGLFWADINKWDIWQVLSDNTETFLWSSLRLGHFEGMPVKMNIYSLHGLFGSDYDLLWCWGFWSKRMNFSYFEEGWWLFPPKAFLCLMRDSSVRYIYIWYIDSWQTRSETSRSHGSFFEGRFVSCSFMGLDIWPTESQASWPKGPKVCQGSPTAGWRISTTSSPIKTKETRYIWMFPKIVVPPNHPFK